MKDGSEDQDSRLTAFNFEHLDVLKEFRFECVLPTSALKQTGIDEVVSKLQELMVTNGEVDFLQ